jgi:hypothetical protein
VEGECDLTQDTGAQIRCDTLGGISTQTFTDLGCSVLPTGAFRVCCPEEPPLSIWCPLD